jgi:hypothetical protein
MTVSCPNCRMGISTPSGYLDLVRSVMTHNRKADDLRMRGMEEAARNEERLAEDSYQEASEAFASLAPADQETALAALSGSELADDAALAAFFL